MSLQELLSAGQDMYNTRVTKHRNLLAYLRLIKNYAENKALNFNVRNRALVFKIQYVVEKACR